MRRRCLLLAAATMMSNEDENVYENHHVNELSNCQTSIPTTNYVNKLCKQQRKWIRLLKRKRNRHKHAIQMLESAIANEVFIMHRLRNNEVDAKLEYISIFLML